MADKAFLERELRNLTDQGKLIEAGWVGLRNRGGPARCSRDPARRNAQRVLCRCAASFSSIMSILDPGSEPTDKDLERMDLISKELRAFINDYSVRNLPTEGYA